MLTWKGDIKSLMMIMLMKKVKKLNLTNLPKLLIYYIFLCRQDELPETEIQIVTLVSITKLFRKA